MLRHYLILEALNRCTVYIVFMKVYLYNLNDGSKSQRCVNPRISYSIPRTLMIA